MRFLAILRSSNNVSMKNNCLKCYTSFCLFLASRDSMRRNRECRCFLLGATARTRLFRHVRVSDLRAVPFEMPTSTIRPSPKWLPLMAYAPISEDSDPIPHNYTSTALLFYSSNFPEPVYHNSKAKSPLKTPPKPTNSSNHTLDILPSSPPSQQQHYSLLFPLSSHSWQKTKLSYY